MPLQNVSRFGYITRDATNLEQKYLVILYRINIENHEP